MAQRMLAQQDLPYLAELERLNLDGVKRVVKGEHYLTHVGSRQMIEFP
jgi:hypothetical protein